MKNDIASRADIELLVNTFYDKVKGNDILGYIFEDIAQVNWIAHLPRMYSFWESQLLDQQTFTGNPMVKHIALSKQTSLTEKEFSEWLRLFDKTVDETFKGPKADEAKIKAANIARLIRHKINTQ